MSISIASESGLVRITANTDAAPHKLFLYQSPTGRSRIPSVQSGIYYDSSSNKYKILIDGIEDNIELLEDTNNKTSSVFYKFYSSNATIYAILASVDSFGDCDIVEVSPYTVLAYSPTVGNVQLTTDVSAIDFGFITDGTFESGHGVGLKLFNAVAPTTAINGLSYVIDVVKVVGDSAYANLSTKTYSELKADGVKCSVVQSIPLSTTDGDVEFYDTSLQYKKEKTYTYIPFLFLVLGSGRYGGWRVTGGVSSVVQAASDRHIQIRGTDDLYVENEPARIVAAQNVSAFQTMATKKFPKINASNGTHFYSVMICAKLSERLEEGSDLNAITSSFYNDLSGALHNSGIILSSGTLDADNVSLNSFQLSGVGAVSTLFKDYRPVIDGTIKLTLSDK